MLLVNTSNVSIKKPMPDRNKILICFRYFPNLLWLLLINTRDAKSGDIEDNYIESALVDIKSACTKNIYNN